MRYSFISLALFAAGAFSAAVEIPNNDVTGPNPGAIKPTATPSGRSQPRPSLVAPTPGVIRPPGGNSTAGMCIDLGSRGQFGNGGRNNSTRPRVPKVPGQGGNKNNGTRPAAPKPSSPAKPATEGADVAANYEIAEEGPAGKKNNGTRGNGNGGKKNGKGGKGKGGKGGKKGGRGGRKRMQCQRFAAKGCAGAAIAKGDRSAKAESIRCTPIVGGGAQGRNATRPGAPGKKDNKPKKDAEELEFEHGDDEDEVEGDDEDVEEFDDDEPELNGRSVRLF